jgi:HEAT repeat protein
MSTIDALRQMTDGDFHRLGDNLLRRIEPRYRRLRTHGLNSEGESIKGQPDSYVGETSRSCSIAVCYTTQRRSWWTKVVADVKEAVESSRCVNEVVSVIPHNSDRDGPKDPTNDWLVKAKAAAGGASFRLIDGHEIAQELDSDHQDLRHLHLGIPYSRICGAAILASAQAVTRSTIQAIELSGRYDQRTYFRRSADRELYRIWQRCLRQSSSDSKRIAPSKMIPLINSSGVGKTSLVYSFASSLANVLPVLLVQARDLSFSAKDTLVAVAVHSLQGFLDPTVRVGEEFALINQLPTTMPLTLIVDGLDEADDPKQVRRAITAWLQSRVGQASILIVTSRSEFWRICSDQYWTQWMPSDPLDEKECVRVDGPFDVARRDPAQGIRIPDRFTEEELENCWLQAGFSRIKLFALSAQTREELRHPFTLRTYLDVCVQNGTQPQVASRTALLELWLKHRLDREADTAERITQVQFRDCLILIAKRIDATNGPTVSVDDLSDVPRYDATHPPGPVVQRLISANILETVSERPDQIRFAIETVQDFYRAEADVTEIRRDALAAAESLTKQRFSEVLTRLLRIGNCAMDQDIRMKFVRSLAALDVRMAAIVLGVAPNQYQSELRVEVAESLAKEISARHRTRAAIAISLLGGLNCSEAIEVLKKHLFAPAEPHIHLRGMGAAAFVNLGDVASAGFVYEWSWMWGNPLNGPYYFRETLSLLRGCNLDFRNALSESATDELYCASGTARHAKAVEVLAYLGDERLVEHLTTRLNDNGLLLHYENYALIAIGTHPAAVLFARSLMAVADQLAQIHVDGGNRDARDNLVGSVYFTGQDLRYLLTPAFEAQLQPQLESESHDLSWLASNIAKRGLSVRLMYQVAVSAAKRKNFRAFDPFCERSIVTPEQWMEWWHQTTDVAVRHQLFSLIPLYPTLELEEILLDCLDSPEFLSQAVRILGEYGSIRSLPRLRQLLEAVDGANSPWATFELFNVIGELRDHASVPLLKSLAWSADADWRFFAIVSLGYIGTREAEEALYELIDDNDNEDSVVAALIDCGNQSAMDVVVALAKTKSNGPEWICERIRRLTWMRRWTKGEYYTHIHTSDLVEYLDDAYSTQTPAQALCCVRALGIIDSPEVRCLLRKWMGRAASFNEEIRSSDSASEISWLCCRELTERGDEAAIPYILDQHLDREDRVYVWAVSNDLRHFPAHAVRAELRERLKQSTNNSAVIRILALLGRFGDTSDEDDIRGFLDHDDDHIANIASESYWRVAEPLLVPERWSEL